MSQRRLSGALAALLLLTTCTPHISSPPASQPNIIVVPHPAQETRAGSAQQETPPTPTGAVTNQNTLTCPACPAAVAPQPVLINPKPASYPPYPPFPPYPPYPPYPQQTAAPAGGSPLWPFWFPYCTSAAPAGPTPASEECAIQIKQAVEAARAALLSRVAKTHFEAFGIKLGFDVANASVLEAVFVLIALIVLLGFAIWFVVRTGKQSPALKKALEKLAIVIAFVAVLILLGFGTISYKLYRIHGELKDAPIVTPGPTQDAALAKENIYLGTELAATQRELERARAQLEARASSPATGAGGWAGAIVGVLVGILAAIALQRAAFVGGPSVRRESDAATLNSTPRPTYKPEDLSEKRVDLWAEEIERSAKSLQELLKKKEAEQTAAAPMDATERLKKILEAALRLQLRVQEIITYAEASQRRAPGLET